jgi:hypothetical protein
MNRPYERSLNFARLITISHLKFQISIPLSLIG